MTYQLYLTPQLAAFVEAEAQAYGFTGCGYIRSLVGRAYDQHLRDTLGPPPEGMYEEE